MKNSESKEVHQEILSWFKKKIYVFLRHQLTVA